MTTYTNKSQVSLSAAVYLACDHYDYVPNAISATALMKPIRQRVLAPRVPKELATTPLTSVVKSRIGTSIHDGVEKAWSGTHYKRAMKALGYPDSIIDRIIVNPERPLTPNDIPVYMEKRSFKEYMGYTISGKFDFVAEGRVEDFKSTGTFTWTKDTKGEDYKLQGSIYRWLNPEIITQDVMAVQFFFTDWAAYNLKSQKDYPAAPVMTKVIPLLSLDDTEAYVRSRIMDFELHKDSGEPDLPECTDTELWRDDPVWKYYKNPQAFKDGKRSTKNYDTASGAHAHLVKDGNVGMVAEVPGQAKACLYCPAFPVCTQKDRLIASGHLKIT